MKDDKDKLKTELRRLLETAPRKLIEVDSFVDHLFDGLTAHQTGHWGWLIAYGDVYTVDETDLTDSSSYDGTATWTVWASGQPDRDDEEGDG